MIHFTSAATIRHLLKLIIKAIKVRNDYGKGRNGVRGEVTKKWLVLKIY